jgi:hypothetical protein
MKISSEIRLDERSRIQIADASNGGNSSWAVKSGNQDSSIRLAWYNEGQFDPISSAELPIWGLVELVEAAAEHNLFSSVQIEELVNCLKRSSSNSD